MSLSDLASLGSFVSGVAVLASLVFLFFQMRQMTEQVKQSERNQQAAIRQGRATYTMGSLRSRATSESLAEAWFKATRDASNLTDAELLRVTVYCRQAFYGWEDSFYQHQEGLLNENGYGGFLASTKFLLGLAGWRVAWKQNRTSYGREFVEWMDNLISETPVAPPSLGLTRWKTDITAENALAVR